MHLPGNNATRLKEATSRSIIRGERLADRLSCSFLDGLGATVAIQISSRIARIDRVDLDRSVSQFPGKLHGHHIENRLGTVVAQRFEGSERPIRIGVPSERT